MNFDEQMLLRAICENKLQDARKLAKRILEADKTKKNRNFCQRMLTRLEASSMNLIELPANLSGILLMEDVSVSFRESRYYLGQREADLYAVIEKMHGAAEKLAEMGILYHNATLIYGHSGTGKTTFGKYVAYKLGLPFAYINMSTVIDSHLGGTSKNISSIFDFIRKTPCVFMIDEMDAIGSKRDSSHDVVELSRVTVSMIQNFDTLPNGVTVLAATNRMDSIDEALVRRFPIRHEVKLFNQEERYQMACKFLEDIGLDVDPTEIHHITDTERPQAEVMDAIVQMVADKIMTGKEELHVS